MSLVKQQIAQSFEAKQRLLQSDELIATIEAIALAITTALQQGKRIYFCGNGGSAADAQHLAAELSGAYYNRNRRALPAEALHTNSSYLTAVANDFGYNAVYSRLVNGIMEEGDVLVGLSTSGNSANVVEAFKAAVAKNIITVGFTGEKPNELQALSTIHFAAPSTDTPRIQALHMLAGHTVCQMVEAAIFPPNPECPA